MNDNLYGGNMLIIPQIYLKNGKVPLRKETRSALFHENPIETAKAIKDSGATMLHIVDLNVHAVGLSPNLPFIKAIHKEVGLSIFVDGGFKTRQAVEACLAAGSEFVVLGTIAYQQPNFLEELCKTFPGKIGAHIDVKAGHVTIPGYAVIANKTSFDYAGQFLESGVRYIIYSDVRADGTTGDENIQNLYKFCFKVNARIICASDIFSLKDIEKIMKLGAPRLEGLILSKSLEEDRIDMRSALARVSELTISSDSDSTIAEI